MTAQDSRVGHRKEKQMESAYDGSLRFILDAHDRYAAPESLSESLGDGYLFRRNPVYRNLRELALGLGFKYTLWSPLEHFSYPLVSLPDILNRHHIPYRDNVTTLRRLESLQPGNFDMSEIEPHSATCRNQALHESAHCVLETVFQKLYGDAWGDSRNEVVFRALYGESFANTVEDMTAMFIGGRLSRFFSKFCVNAHNNSTQIAVQQALLDRFDYRFLFQLTLFGYLHYNFMYEKLGRPELKRCLSLIEPAGKITPQHEQLMLAVLQNCMRMSNDARTSTSGFYFKTLGFKSPTGLNNLTRELTRFSFADMFRKDERLKVSLLMLGDLLENGIRGNAFAVIEPVAPVSIAAA
jgi:hypothetical protein